MCWATSLANTSCERGSAADSPMQAKLRPGNSWWTSAATSELSIPPEKATTFRPVRVPERRVALSARCNIRAPAPMWGVDWGGGSGGSRSSSLRALPVPTLREGTPAAPCAGTLVRVVQPAQFGA
jgi:hypothetical protein